MGLSSCNQDLLEDEITETKQKIISRSDGPCKNFIKNGDFETVSGCNISVSTNYFQNCVDNWFCYAGSADIVSPTFNHSMFASSHDVSPFWENVSFTENFTFMQTGRYQNFGEGIYQKVDLKPGVSYCLSLKTASTLWNRYPDNGNLTLNVQFASNELDSACGLLDINPECQDDNSCLEFPVSLVYPSLHEVDNLVFELDYVATGIYIWASTDNYCESNDTNSTCTNPNGQKPIDGIFLDDVRLSCTIPNVTGIEAKEVGKCEYQFGLESLDDFDYTSIHWSFGDGTSSMNQSQAQLKEYETPGIYTVRVLIRDENGCCKLLETTVSCGEAECDYQLCWSENFVPEPLEFNETIQSLEEIEGYTIMNDLGVEEKIVLFNPAIDPVGNYQLIFDTFVASLATSFGVSVSDIYSLHPNLDCVKGTQQMPGFYIENCPVQLLNFYGMTHDYPTFNLVPHVVPFIVECE